MKSIAERLAQSAGEKERIKYVLEHVQYVKGEPISDEVAAGFHFQGNRESYRLFANIALPDGAQTALMHCFPRQTCC